jgi:hypothetical protein
MIILMRGIHREEITMSNLDKSVEFYQRNFGLKLTGTTEQHILHEGNLKGVRMKIAFLQAGEVALELIQYLDPRGERITTKP